MEASLSSPYVKPSRAWLLANFCVLLASGLVLGAAAHKTATVVRSGGNLLTLGTLTEQIRARGREAYVDRLRRPGCRRFAPRRNVSHKT